MRSIVRDWGRCRCEDRGGGWLTGVGLLLCSNLKLRQSSLFLFFISASLISAVSAPIWLKFGTRTGSWCNLWLPVRNGAGSPRKNFVAKNWKTAIGAYSSQLITPEWKRISERLKRLQDIRSILTCTPGCKHSERFCTYKSKKFRFLAILSKFSAVCPLQTFAINRTRGTLHVWKILWTWTYNRRWTIRLKNL